MPVAENYVLRHKKYGPAPRDGYETNNMVHFFLPSPENKDILYHPYPDSKLYEDTFAYEKGETTTLLSDPYYHNYRTMKDFFSHLQGSPHNLGFMEGIGAYEVFGAQFCSSPYLKYTKDVMPSGVASLTAVPLPVKARPWDRKNEYLTDTKFGPWTPADKELKKDPTAVTEGYIVKDPSKITQPDGAVKVNFESTQLKVATNKEGLFKGDWPEFNVSVAFMNYNAEIALKIDNREIYQYAYNPDLAQKVMTSIMGMSNAAYINNISTFCNLVIGGIPRGGPPPEPEGLYGAEISTGKQPPKSKMYEFIQIPLETYNQGYSKYTENKSVSRLEERTKLIGGGLRRFLYETVHVDFAHLSTDYNPAGVEVLSNSCTAFIDSHYRHEFDHAHLASVNNPNYLLNTGNDENTPGHKVKLDYGWVPYFPKMGTQIFAAPGKSVAIKEGSVTTYHVYKQICMVTDDLNPAIRPVTKPVSVTTFFNPQDETTTVFTHYQMLVEFRPQFNRKYLYLDIFSGSPITDENIVNW